MGEGGGGRKECSFTCLIISIWTPTHPPPLCKREKTQECRESPFETLLHFLNSFILVVTEVLRNCRAKGENKLIFMKRMYGGKCIMIHLWPVYKGEDTPVPPNHLLGGKSTSGGGGGGGGVPRRAECSQPHNEDIHSSCLGHLITSRRKSTDASDRKNGHERQKINCEMHQYTTAVGKCALLCTNVVNWGKSISRAIGRGGP